jgi:hypothetical protein
MNEYLRKLVAEKQADPTEFTREEFFARIDEAKKGPTFELHDDETLEDLIKRVGFYLVHSYSDSKYLSISS